jgi:predicted peptidase
MAAYWYDHDKPEGYQPGSKQKHPLILFLHGWDQNGDKEGRTPVQQVRLHGPWRAHGCKDYAKGPDAIKEIGKFFVLAPHLPVDGEWDPRRILDTLNDLLQRPEYRDAIDRNRLYLTGMSWGGRGALRLAIDNPKTFAASAILCPYGGAQFKDHVGGLRDKPIRIYHGENDGKKVVKDKDGKEVVKINEDRLPKNSRALHEALGGDATGPDRLTVYKGKGHNVWELAYDNPELYKWFDKHKKDM